uniref:Transposase-associated domain-containing protein n=1 Tax=Oryza brachyantha TaxID=4533 RepID=J3M5Q8_ORYBR
MACTEEVAFGVNLIGDGGVSWAPLGARTTLSKEHYTSSRGDGGCAGGEVSHVVRVSLRVDDGGDGGCRVLDCGAVCAGGWGEIKGTFRLKETPAGEVAVHVHGAPAGVDVKVMDLRGFAADRTTPERHTCDRIPLTDQRCGILPRTELGLAAARHWCSISMTGQRGKPSQKKQDEPVYMCPCNDCRNEKMIPDSSDVHSHLIRRGFMENYTCGSKHGEQEEPDVDAHEEMSDQNTVNVVAAPESMFVSSPLGGDTIDFDIECLS